MPPKRILLFSILFALLTTQISAESNELKNFSGNWHLRVLDGGEVRKARAILEFDVKKMYLSGFDGCNRITGNLIKDVKTQQLHAQLVSTKMACRESIHRYVSRRLQETITEGFSITKEKKYGIEGITLKSSKHELFFKRMDREGNWF